MAYELAIYEDTCRIIAHTQTCTTISSIPRTYQSGPMIKVGPEWAVLKCDRCNPNVFVVHVTAKSLRDTGFSFTPPPPRNPRGPDGPNHATTHSMGEWQRIIHRKNPDLAFPPYGVAALDVEPMERDSAWWDEAGCRSNDERLGPWLRWLYSTDHTAHWTLTIQKAVCYECPVRAECLEQGVWGYEAWGVWGGATERERKLIRSQWIQKGRVDERPNRPHNPISGTDSAYNSRTVQREDGSRDTATRDSDGLGVGEESGDSETASEDMPEVYVEPEVRRPRTYGRSSGYLGEGFGGW